MKQFVLLLSLLITTNIFSQSDINKSVGEFSELKVYDLINVELISSDENRIEISGKNSSDVIVVNKNGKLKIRMKLEEYFDGNDVMVKLYYTGVDIIDANEGAFISSNETIKQFDLVLKAQEGGSIKLNLDVKSLEVRSYSGGIVNLKGMTTNQSLKINTGGIFKGSEFETTTTKVSISAGGEAYVNASELVDIKIKAGGDVFIYGDPTTINEKRAIGGRIKRMY